MQLIHIQAVQTVENNPYKLLTYQGATINTIRKWLTE
jgi:hypothetical protein